MADQKLTALTAETTVEAADLFYLVVDTGTTPQGKKATPLVTWNTYFAPLANAAYQPLDGDLTSIAALTTTAYGRALLTQADEAALKATINLEIGTDVQAYNAGLAAIAGLSNADGNFIVGNGTAWVAESGATARTSLGLGTAATSNTGDFAAASHNHAATDITTGTFENARIAAGNVTQHQAALSITISQISDFGSYETADVDILKADTGDTLTAGYLSDSYARGTISSGTVTPAPATSQENFQHYTNNGAHTLAPPASPCSVIIEITNGSTAGAITTSGFTVVDGDSFTTTDTHKFICYITKTNASSYLSVKALQ